MNQFNSKNEKIQQCNVSSYLHSSINILLLISVKGTIERIDENDDQRSKRTSERTSVQIRPLSDKVKSNNIHSFSIFHF